MQKQNSILFSSLLFQIASSPERVVESGDQSGSALDPVDADFAPLDRPYFPQVKQVANREAEPFVADLRQRAQLFPRARLLLQSFKHFLLRCCRHGYSQSAVTKERIKRQERKGKARPGSQGASSLRPLRCTLRPWR